MSTMEGGGIERDVTHTTTRSPQPRLMGIALALLSGILFCLVSVAILFASQQARLLAALDVIALLPEIDEDQGTKRLELISQLNTFLESFSRLDQFLLSGYSLLAGRADPSPSLDVEQALLQKLVTSEGVLSRSERPLVGSIPALLLQPTFDEKSQSSPLPTTQEMAVTALAEETKHLALLLDEAQKISLALSTHKEETDLLIDRIKLVRIETHRFFSLPQAPSAPDTTPALSEYSSEYSSVLYQSGMLRGIPVIEGLPDGLETSEALVSAIGSIGGKTVVEAGISQENVQIEMSNLIQAGADLYADSQRLSAESRNLMKRQTELQLLETEALQTLQTHWLRLLRERLILRVLKIEPFSTYF